MGRLSVQDRSARRTPQPLSPLEQDDDPAPGRAELEGALQLGDNADLGPQGVRAGAYARVYISAVAKKLPPSEYVQSTGQSLVMRVPRGSKLPEATLEWKVPEVWNAFERNRARAYAVAFAT